MLRRWSFLAAPFRGFNAEHHVYVAAFPFCPPLLPVGKRVAVVRVGRFVGRSLIVMLRRRSFLAAPFRGFNAEHHANVAAFSFCPPLLPVGKRRAKEKHFRFRGSVLHWQEL